MKYYRTTLKGVIDLLQKIFVEGLYADKVISYALKNNPKWGARDRSFVAESTYELVRWWRLINESLAEENDNSVTNHYRLFATWQLINGNELPDWEEFAGIDKNKIIENASKLKSDRKVRESIPDWLDELGSKELGEEVWSREIAELNKPAKLVIRVNTIKITSGQVQRMLKEQEIETITSEEYPDALIVLKRKNLHNLVQFKKGWFEIQDASSQLVAQYLQVEPGMKVIDACAGAGGKSVHIGALMNNTGTIISMDLNEKKLEELTRRAERAGVTIIETRVVNDLVVDQLTNIGDRLLLDVPCSGLGVLRRKPHTKWKLSAEKIEEIKNVQKKILSDYSKMLKPGGLMVYATCSILPGENELQIEEFLKTHPAFELEEDRKVMPSEGFDGFYMARVKRISW